jgi:hypothetical protein
LWSWAKASEWALNFYGCQRSNFAGAAQLTGADVVVDVTNSPSFEDKDQLMHPELVTAFINEFHREVNRQRAEQDGDRNRTAQDL